MAQLEKTISTKQLVVIMAHPDDAELLCYGGIKHFSDNGYAVNVLVVANVHTKGNGGVSPKLDQQRERETIEAFRTIPAVNILFGNFEDGHLNMTTNLVSFIENKLNEIKPGIVITHHVDTLGYDHQDHTAVGKAVTNATYRCQVNTLLHAQPHCVKTSFVANYYIDVTRYFKQKLEVLAKHESQRGKHYFDKAYQELKYQHNRLFHSRDPVGPFNNALFESYNCSHHLEV